MNEIDCSALLKEQDPEYNSSFPTVSSLANLANTLKNVEADKDCPDLINREGLHVYIRIILQYLFSAAESSAAAADESGVVVLYMTWVCAMHVLLFCASKCLQPSNRGGGLLPWLKTRRKRRHQLLVAHVLSLCADKDCPVIWIVVSWSYSSETSHPSCWTYSLCFTKSSHLRKVGKLYLKSSECLFSSMLVAFSHGLNFSLESHALCHFSLLRRISNLFVWNIILSETLKWY